MIKEHTTITAGIYKYLDPWVTDNVAGMVTDWADKITGEETEGEETGETGGETGETETPTTEGETEAVTSYVVSSTVSNDVYAYAV